MWAAALRHLSTRWWAAVSVMSRCSTYPRPACGWHRSRSVADAGRVRWIVANLFAWQGQRQYNVWHDRAVFHFLTTDEDQTRYVDALNCATTSASVAVFGCFAPDGPQQCSRFPLPAMTPRGWPPSSERSGSPSPRTAKNTSRRPARSSHSRGMHSAAGRDRDIDGSRVRQVSGERNRAGRRRRVAGACRLRIRGPGGGRVDGACTGWRHCGRVDAVWCNGRRRGLGHGTAGGAFRDHR